MFTVTKQFGFDAAHRLIGHEGKCKHLHGHRYTVEITCTGELDPIGRVVDFSVIKDVFGWWIDDRLDHGTICNQDDHSLMAFLQVEKQKFFPIRDNPTAENIAKLIHNMASAALVPCGITVTGTKVWETPTCFATYTEDKT